jgi:hypothetical protein
LYKNRQTKNFLRKHICWSSDFAKEAFFNFEPEVLLTDATLEELLLQVDAVDVALEGALPAEALAAVGALEGSNFVVNNFFVLLQITFEPISFLMITVPKS